MGANGEELGRHEGEWTVEGKDIIIDVKSDGVAVKALGEETARRQAQSAAISPLRETTATTLGTTNRHLLT